MSKLNTLNPKRILQYVLASCWVMWVVIQYLGYRPNYLTLFYDHPYSGYLSMIALLSAGLGAYSYFTLKKRKKWVFSLRPWWLIVLGLMISTSVLVAFRASNNLNITPVATASVYFWFHSLFYLGSLLILGLSLAGLGQFVYARLTVHKPSSMVALAIGFSLLGFYAVLLGLAGLLTSWTLWPILLLTVFFQRVYIWELVQTWLLRPFQWRIYHWWQPVVAFIGLLLIATYWLGSLKAFPVGFDGAALYANLSHLTAEQQALPASNQAFAWSVVMSWGELLFGSISLSLLLSHFMYLPAGLLLYQIFRYWLKPSYALAAIVVTLSTTMWSFHAMVDEKVDLGFLFICLSIVYLLIDLFKAVKNTALTEKITQDPTLRTLLVVGWLSGFAFSIKYTAIFLLAAWIAMFFYRFGKGRLLAFWLFFFLGFLFISGFHSWGNIPIENNSEAQILGGTFLLVGVVFLISGLLKDRSWIKQVVFSLVFAGFAFSIAYAPWGGKHLAENKFEWSINNVLFGNPEKIPLYIPNELLSYERRNNQSPRDFQFKLTSGQDDQVGSGPLTREERQARRRRNIEEIESFDLNREEVQRYIGYEAGMLRYTSIPFDLTFDQNVRQTRHKDIGFIYLALLPFIFSASTSSGKSWLRNGLVATTLILWMGSNFWSLTQATNANEHQPEIQVHNQSFIDLFAANDPPVFIQQLMISLQAPFNALAAQATGMFSALSNLPLLVYLPFLTLLLAGMAFALRHQWKNWPEELRLCMAFVFAFFLYWLFLGNAIVWYALPIFALLMGLVFYYWQEKEAMWGANYAKGIPRLLGAAIAAQLSMSILILFSASTPGQPTHKLFNWPMVEFVTQPNISKDQAYSWFSQYYQRISKEVNANPEDRIIRINTYLQFHLDENNKRVLEDNQLNAFKQISDRLKSPRQFVDVLQANGFKYVIYDINSPTIDETPEQSLREKCLDFLKVMITHPDVEILITDNYVTDASAKEAIRLPNGQMVNQVRPGINGKTAYRGSVVLFKIKD